MNENYEWGNNVIRPYTIRNEHVIRALPKGICKTCRKDTKGYDDSCCEECAKGYTNAFYKIAEEMFGIKIEAKLE